MISLWITIGLIIAATSVSTLGAYFSIVGIGALFSGALIAVCLMAGALEFAKFVLAAYLHQTWKRVNLALKLYMTFAIVVLSIITSIGIFGFLSDAYQATSLILDAETVKLENFKKQSELATSEIDRLQYSIEEIPENRVTKRLEARKAIEPRILELNKKVEDAEREITAANLKILDVKKKVGPLIYIARALNVSIDETVKYLILIFVLVFDPLAICLVIASTFALETRRNPHLYEEEVVVKPKAKPVAAEKPVVKEAPADSGAVKVPEPAPQMPESVPAPAVAKADDDEIIVQMNFKDEAMNVSQTNESESGQKNTGSKVM